MTRPAVLAVDAGNSKTDVALVSSSGELLAWVRGGGFQPHGPKLPAAIGLLADLVAAAVRLTQDGGAPSGGAGYVAQRVSAFLAHCDLPIEQEILQTAVEARGWAPAVTVDNDTFAILRAGAGVPYGVAVVCGGGMNCVARGPDGRVARWPALGRRSGDWGGGEWLGEEVLWWAVRDEDGRGPRTLLREAVADWYGLTDVTSVCVGFHLGHLPEERLHELVPVLFEVAGQGDAVAVSLVERLGDEVAAWAGAALGRLDWGEVSVPVVLGGGVLTGGDTRLMARIGKGLPGVDVRVLDAPPIVGSALHGLDRLGATSEAVERRLRAGFATRRPSCP
ncbi:N-acetylglucosamine kinase [Nonomuraea sp. WAC 01424]|uniref:N-acetylglucosamine kinase n=1 Tax=Nonomuraea sp. WAC 01424 TaxID=2203200 RepID=UPI0021AE1225|nr:BadF/BadG/BcrA/BcrD ATPase family protein [Nonomuraea sp. WAC 01424]